MTYPVVTTYDILNKYEKQFERHAKSGCCARCKGESILRPPYILCGYGAWLVKMYDKVMDRLWDGITLDGKPEPLYFVRPWTQKWMGFFQRVREAYWYRHNHPLVIRGKRLLERFEHFAEGYYMRNISHQELSAPAQHGHGADDPSDRGN